MTEEAYPGLRRAARAADPDTDTPETKNEPDAEKDEAEAKKKKDTEMNEQEQKDAAAKAKAEGVAEGKAQGFAEANARAATVMASEHYAGNEKLAAKLLAKDALSADDIVDSLSAAAPAPQGSASDDDEEAKAKAEMRKNLSSEQPGQTGGEAGEITQAKAQDNLNALADEINGKANA